jgi:hypothetical protein
MPGLANLSNANGTEIGSPTVIDRKDIIGIGFYATAYQWNSPDGAQKVISYRGTDRMLAWPPPFSAATSPMDMR